MSSTSLLRSLFSSNKSLLTQKLGLLDALLVRHPPSAATAAFATPCPIVGSSIGQHLRHSMDHTELAVLVAQNAAHNVSNKDTSSSRGNSSDAAAELHYDLRVRGGTLENDLELSRERIVHVQEVLEDIATTVLPPTSDEPETIEESATRLLQTPLSANFYLTAERKQEESGLPSTIARELGFVAHHTIHHLAMVRIIALQSAGLTEADLPDGLGRAPSTVRHDMVGRQ